MYDIYYLFNNYGQTLFSSFYTEVCLHHLFPDKQEYTHAMTFRPRRHNFSLTLFLCVNLQGTPL